MFKLTAILAGAGFAQAALLLVLMGPQDRLQANFVHSGLTLCVYVDDVALHVTGPPEEVATTLTQSTSQISDSLEGEFPHASVSSRAVG